MKTVVIIGGGIAGCSAALELAEKGYKVILLESKSELLSGSSDNTPCRLGLGFHYADQETAVKYLKSTLAFVKKYGSEYIVGNSKSIDHPLRRGRYFIVNDSSFEHEKVLRIYKAIQKAYAKLIEEDPKNAVFGESDNFYKILSVGKYKEQVNSDRVTVGIETAEQILDWPKFKTDLIERVRSHPNITVKTSTSVKLIKDASDQGFIVTTSQKEEHGDFVINAAWQNAEALGYQSGYLSTPRTNRLKVIIEVELPPELINSNSMFFCFGPHCSFNNTGDGKGFISYEPVTNIEKSSDIIFPKNLQRYLDGDVTDLEKVDIAQKIIAGVTTYIPAMDKAKFTGVIKFGVVKIKTDENANISSPTSDIHKRRESGVEEEQVGVTKNSAMKLLYGEPNANEVVAIIEKHGQINATIQSIAEQVFTSKPVLAHFLTKTMQRYWTVSSSSNSFDATQLKDITEKKQSVIEEIKQFNISSLKPVPAG